MEGLDQLFKFMAWAVTSLRRVEALDWQGRPIRKIVLTPSGEDIWSLQFRATVHFGDGNPEWPWMDHLQCEWWKTGVGVTPVKDDAIPF